MAHVIESLWLWSVGLEVSVSCGVGSSLCVRARAQFGVFSGGLED